MAMAMAMADVILVWAICACMYASARATSVYEEGPYAVQTVSIKGAGRPNASLPLRPILAFVPKEPGAYPAVIFLHGFMMLNSYYSSILHRISSHGFIVLAPQLPLPFFRSDASPDISDVRTILLWLPGNLQPCFPAFLNGSTIDLDKVVLTGHSRGGKIAFGVAFQYPNYKGVIGIDPVDGTPIGQTLPHILNGSFHLTSPVLVLGTGLGSQGLLPSFLPSFPPCAPARFGYSQFFLDSSSPKYRVVAREFGHMDFVDDNVGIIGSIVTAIICKRKTPRAPLRNFTSGLVVAFLKATLFENPTSLNHIITNPQDAPILIEATESLPSSDISNLQSTRNVCPAMPSISHRNAEGTDAMDFEL